MKVFSHHNPLQTIRYRKGSSSFASRDAMVFQSIYISEPIPKRIVLAVKLVAKSSEGERAKQQSEVTQCNIEVAWDHQQIDYDQCEPARYYISEDLRLESDPNTGHYLDHPNTQHSSWP